MSRYSAGLWAGWAGVRVPESAGTFLFTTASRPSLGSTQPPIQWVPGALSWGVKRPESVTDHSPLSSAEVKNVWRYTSTPQYTYMAWCSVKEEFYFEVHFDEPGEMSFRVYAWGSIPSKGVSLRHHSQSVYRAHSAFSTMGNGTSFRGVKRLKREAEHSSPYRAGHSPM
jgi:hypothetical protein